MLTKKKKIKIAKHLAAIDFIVLNWHDKEWSEFYDCVAYNVVEIAYAVGGQRMMSRIPALVSELERVTHEHTD